MPDRAGGVIDLWWADLDRDLAAGRLAILSPEETAAAARLQGPGERRRRLAARCFVREILAARLEAGAAAIAFDRAPGGKPRVAAPAGGSAIEFSLSHSAAVAVLAVAAARPVGIDVEFADPTLPIRPIAAASCEPALWQRLAALPDAVLMPAFLRLWVRHEAAAKVDGDGLGAAMVTVAPPPALWCCDLAAPEGYAAALAADGSAPAAIRVHRWVG